MKKDIVICCQDMLTAIQKQKALVDGAMKVMIVEVGDIRRCPWCGKTLPFPLVAQDPEVIP